MQPPEQVRELPLGGCLHSVKALGTQHVVRCMYHRMLWLRADDACSRHARCHAQRDTALFFVFTSVSVSRPRAYPALLYPRFRGVLPSCRPKDRGFPGFRVCPVEGHTSALAKLHGTEVAYSYAFVMARAAKGPWHHHLWLRTFYCMQQSKRAEGAKTTFITSCSSFPIFMTIKWRPLHWTMCAQVRLWN